MNRKEFFGLLAGLPTSHLVPIQTAYWLAKNAHRLETRDNGERYFEHPRAVAAILIEKGHRDVDILVLALLHDVVEDTNTPASVIVDLFGHETWARLLVLSKRVPVFDPVTGQVTGRTSKSADEYYTSVAQGDRPVRLVKCADRLHNLRTCGGWTIERKSRYFTETRTYVLPIAEATDPALLAELKAECERLQQELVG